jgi:hypothetical protein
MPRNILKYLEDRIQKREFRILGIRLFTFYLLSSVFLLLTTHAYAAPGIYRTINFQGKVVNKAGGTNIANGNYPFVFKLYNDPTAGDQLPVGTPWSETQALVPVTDGIFRVTIGSSTSIPAGLDFNSDLLYLDITFNGETFGSRVRLTAVPYAFNAEKVSGLTVTSTTGTLTIPNATTVTFSGANNLTFTTTNLTTATLPSGSITLVDLTTAQVLTNKTIGSTGLVFNGAATDITTVSNEDFVISPNGTGKVGIGNSSPTAKFDVTGTASVSGVFTVGDGTTNAIQSPYGPLTLNYKSGLNTWTAGLTLQSTTGNVGIGNTNPSSKLDVAGNTNISGYATAGASLSVGSYGALGGVGNGVFSGYVGIGTATPTRLLDVSSLSSTAMLANFDWSPASLTTTTSDLFSLNIGQYGIVGNIFNVKDNGSSVFAISQSAITNNLPTQFTAAGDVGIAYDINFTNSTTSFLKSAAPLYIVAGEVFNSSDLTLRTYNYGNVIVDSHLYVSNPTVTGKALGIFNQLESQDILTASASGVTRFTITNAGSVGIGTTAPSVALHVVGNGRFTAIGSGTYTGAVNRTSDGTFTTATSDIRFKKDIITIQSPLDKVLALRGVTFNWIDPQNPKRMMGMIAQEVESVVPELVFQNEVDGFYGINYGEATGLIIEAMKEQHGIISTSRDSLASISAQLSNITNRVASAEATIRQLTNTPIGTSAGYLNTAILFDNNIVSSSSGLTLLGTTTTYDLAVLNKLTFGLLTIESDASASGSIQTAVVPLQLQKDSMGNLEIMGSKIVIDIFGNMVARESITARELKTNKLTILDEKDATNGAVLASSAGKSEIAAGQTRITIQTSPISEKSLIFVTPENTPVGVAAKKLNETSIEISIASPMQEALKVNWWIIN